MNGGMFGRPPMPQTQRPPAAEMQQPVNPPQQQQQSMMMPQFSREQISKMLGVMLQQPGG